MTFIPVVIEKHQANEVSYDIFSRLLKERIIFLDSEITSQSVNVWIAELLFLSSKSDEDIYIYINSPGGSVNAGLALYDTMKYIKPKITTICVGTAASMAAFILAAGDTRCALENSEIMIHEISTKIDGNASYIFNHTKWLEKLKDKTNEILAKNTKHTVKEIEDATLKDNFMDTKEALEFRIIDKILIQNDL